MSGDRPVREISDVPEPSDDVEILEVVVVDDTGPRATETDPGDDVEISFDDDITTLPRVAVQPPPKSDEAPPGERLIRLQADFENFQKRVDRDRLDYLLHATGTLVKRLLPILDNFDRAIAAAGSVSGVDPVLDGIFLIQKQLLDELTEEGLRPMDCLGTPFDPSLQEAVATEVDPSVPAHTVTLVHQKGYFFHDRVLRPALVRVSVDGPSGLGAADGAKEA